MKTLDFYNQNALQYATDTLYADMSRARSAFCAYLPKGAYLLDFGCGSGRDTKAFLEAGYHVDAVDGSGELCKIAAEYTGIPVRHMVFQELAVENKYDGIWACASILHLQKAELTDVFGRMYRAMQVGGILYTSFKYGTFEGERNGRHFTYFTEDTFADFLKRTSLALTPKAQWLSGDVRPDRGSEQWLNIILEKTEYI